MGGGEGGHIVFGADPVGITYTNTSLGGRKKRIRFGDIDPIFKVTQGLIMLENGLSAPCSKK